MAVSKQFILAGNATFTIQTPDDGHRTFKVVKAPENPDYPPAWFVKLLAGPENTEDFVYLGMLRDDGTVRLTGKSALREDSKIVKLLRRVLFRTWTADYAAFEAHGYKTLHVGKCGRCGRSLTVPESIESGIGPECAKKL